MYPDLDTISQLSPSQLFVCLFVCFTCFPRDHTLSVHKSRKKQWPRLKRPREEGKLAFFCKKEPDKLHIDGEYIIP